MEQDKYSDKATVIPAEAGIHNHQEASSFLTEVEKMSDHEDKPLRDLVDDEDYTDDEHIDDDDDDYHEEHATVIPAEAGIHKEHEPVIPAKAGIHKDLSNDDSESDMVNSNNVLLTLNCEIGSVSLSLAELMQLNTKSILEIGSLPPTVRLTLNGRVVATGILVEIKERLGLKLVSIEQR